MSAKQGFLMVGFSTVYTMLPVFSLVLDRDVTGKIAITYPELYKELTKGRSLSYKTFFVWVLISLYQGAVIMFGALLLFEDEFIHVVAISFTALVLTELTMVALTIRYGGPPPPPNLIAETTTSIANFRYNTTFHCLILDEIGTRYPFKQQYFCKKEECGQVYCVRLYVQYSTDY